MSMTMTAVIAVIAVIAVLHVSRDIGVYFYDLKVSAVVGSTLREWRHRINSYVHLHTRDDRRLVMGTSKIHEKTRSSSSSTD